MIKFSEKERKMLDEARELFPHEGCGFNFDEWRSVTEWGEWLEKKIIEEKKRLAEETKNKNG